MLRRYFALSLALVVVGCGASDPAPTATTGGAKSFDRLTVNGQAVVLASPRSRTRKVVIYAHGAGETAAGSFVDPENAPVFTALLRGGYAVVATNAHGDNWGNAASERDYRALIPVLRERRLTDVYVLAQSMGAFGGLQLLSAVKVKAWAGLFPVCNLAAVSKLGQFTDAIQTAHGPALAVALRDLSPIRPAYRRGLPMRFWASPDDKVIPKPSNTDVCAAAARQAGAAVTVTTTRGDHGDASNFDPPAVVRFFDAA